MQDSEAPAEDDNSRVLRSGSTHDRVPPPPPPSSLPHDNKGNILTNQELTMATNTIKLLPTTASVRAFAGNEPDYSARDFILQCEDVMNNSFVSEPGDKISFIRSRLKPGSEASAVMFTSTFMEPQQTKDYAQFRSHFLESFGEDVRHSLVKGVNVAVTKLISAVESKELLAGQVDAYRLSTDMGVYLKAGGWTEGENMSLSNVLKFFEFFVYMAVIKGQFRKGSLSLAYGPTDKLHDFMLKIKTKMEEKDGAPVPAVASVDQKAANVSASSSVVAATTEKPKRHCSYCQRDGHTVDYCLKRQRDRKATREKGGSPMSGKSASQKTPAASKSRAAGYHTGKFCFVHGAGRHTTEECFSVLQLKKERAGKFVKGSGEAERPPKTDPG
ncbi:uncharacterized protein LOC126995877 [Eriocheir sinensis]|uniref:uncharacterized protein LOC126995877 n=1 Tax=Eriocheir sinensis TaxID=95602 RepID=UPI0021C7BB34|nr:uncharacterized protein LOC126995877 [Eriocheir sinensis]